MDRQSLISWSYSASSSVLLWTERSVAFVWPSGALAAVVLSLAVAAPQSVRAARPRILFDTAASIGCCDVTSSEFARANPDERLVEARFQVSALFAGDEANDATQFFYRIESRQPNIRVVDYLPKTTTTTNIAGNVVVEQAEETSKSLGLALSGTYDQLLRGTGSASLGSSENATVKYELLPPLEMLVGSGTLHRGAGVYFKLKSSPRVSLEGSKQFVLVLRVPKTWRGGLVHLYCQAQQRRRGVVRSLDSSGEIGADRFVVALYAEGDLSAKATAGDLADAEAALRRVEVSNWREIQRRSYAGAAHKVAALLAAADSKIPDAWLEQLIFSWPLAPVADYVEHLPEPVQREVVRYRSARIQLDRLDGDQERAARSICD